MLRFTAALVGMLAAANASAGLVNGYFSSPSLGFADIITQAQADAGWYTRGSAATGGNWNIVGKKANRDSNSYQSLNEQRGIAQIFTDPGLVGTGRLAFDYEAVDPATGGPLAIHFWLVGYSGAGNMNNAEDINPYLLLANRPVSGPHYTVDVLVQDTLSFNNGTFSGLYLRKGVDFGAGYDLFGIAFSAGVGQAGRTVSLDNVRVEIPEPAALALLGLGLVVMGVLRRRTALT